jgi:DMSO reductase anchor subunit
MAVGGFWSMLWTFPLVRKLPFLLIGICLGTGMFASLAHLGTRKKAWRALGNLRRSWLSREVLFTGLFGAGWLFTFLSNLILHSDTVELLGLTATLGLGLIYSMAKVYRLPSIPAWNTWKTNAVFIVSALLLGQSLLAVLLPYGSDLTDSLILILLLAQLLLMDISFSPYPLHPIRAGLILAGMILTIMNFILGGAAQPWFSVLIFLIVVAEETIGKWSFYQAAHKLFSSQ